MKYTFIREQVVKKPYKEREYMLMPSDEEAMMAISEFKMAHPNFDKGCDFIYEPARITIRTTKIDNDEDI